MHCSVTWAGAESHPAGVRGEGRGLLASLLRGPWGRRDTAGHALGFCVFGGRSRKQGLLLPLPWVPSPQGRHFYHKKGDAFLKGTGETGCHCNCV